MADGHGNDIATKNVSENYVNDIKTAIKSIRKKGRRPDKDSISEFILNNFATNVDQVFIESCIRSLIEGNILRNKPTSRGNSYFIVEEKPTEEEKQGREEDFTDEFDIDKVAINFETPLVKDISREGNMDETLLAAEFLALKNFTMDQIQTLKMKVDGIEAVNKCHQSRLEEEIRFLRDENASKNLIIKLLLENLNRQSQSPMTAKHCSHDVINLTQNQKNHEIESTNFNDFNDGIAFNKNDKSKSLLTPSSKSTKAVSVKTCNANKVLDNDTTPTERREIKTNNSHKNTNLKTVPGNTSYSRVTSQGKNIAIFGDSIISNIKKKEFNKHVKGNVQIKSFSGATTADMDVYVQPTLQKKVADIAVIHVGTNDIGFKGTSDIVKSIIKVGKRCRQSGISDIFISSVVNRKHEHIQNKVNELNSILESKCVDNNFILIDNSNILTSDICKDNIHLNFNGTCKLANNIIRHINLIDSSSA